MNKAKLKDIELYSGIDTIEVRCDNEIEPIVFTKKIIRNYILSSKPFRKAGVTDGT